MDKKETIRRKNERNVKLYMDKNKLEIDTLIQEICKNGQRLIPSRELNTIMEEVEYSQRRNT